jgi:hypothetical protein
VYDLQRPCLEEAPIEHDARVGRWIDGIMDLTMGKTFTDRHQVVTSFEIFGSLPRRVACDGDI